MPVDICVASKWLEAYIQKYEEEDEPVPLLLRKEGSDSVADDSVAGDPVAGDPVAGDPVAGDPVAGDPVALFTTVSADNWRTPNSTVSE